VGATSRPPAGSSLPCRRTAEIDAELASTLYYAATDDRRRRVVLLLEDVSGGRQGDVLDCCSIADAEH
jgi:hypothetical protein